MKSREAMILVVMNAILAIAWRSLKNSGLWRGLNQLSYEATGDKSWSFVGSNFHVINESMDEMIYIKWVIYRTANKNSMAS